MPAPDRIALLTSTIPPYRLPVLRELERRCKDLRVFVSTKMDRETDLLAEWDRSRVQIQRSLTWRSTWRHPHGFTEPLAINLPYDTIPQLARFDPDAVISSELGMRTMQAAAFTSFSRRRRLVVWAAMSETTEQGRGLVRPLVRRALLHVADAVMVNGESGSRYVRRFGVDKEKVFLVPQTTDIGPFLNQPPGRAAAIRHRLLYSGRLVELKGLIPFMAHIAAWATRNPEKQVDLCIAGDGPLRSVLAQLPCPKNLSLTFLGHVSYDRLPEVYARAGLLVFPTLADEWGLVVVEAMASGLPVLGSLYSQAVEDLVSDGVNGWTFRPDHPPEVDAAVNRALDAPVEQLNRMAARARSTARSLTPSTMADRMMAAIEYACASSGGPQTGIQPPDRYADCSQRS
jgi:glycosyltransferase involved in cell wall biosynthesis